MREKWTLIMILGFLPITVLASIISFFAGDSNLIYVVIIILGLYWVFYCDGKGDIFGV